MGPRLIASLAVLAALAATSESAAAVSPAQLYSSALSKARAQQSVHYVSAQASGGRAVKIVGDAALDRGVQHITYRNAGRVGYVTVLVVANTAYIRGDAFTLGNYMGIPAASAASWAGKWLSLAQGTSGFTTVAAAVRLESTLDELAMPQPFRSAGTSTRHGRRVVGVRSSFTRSGHAVTETLYVDASSLLPVEQVGHSGAITMTAAFSRWNERVTVSKPSHAIPIR